MTTAAGTGTREDPWILRTPPGGLGVPDVPRNNCMRAVT
jgi:hypothetical protein